MPIKELEEGKFMFANANFDLSSNTELEMTIIKPDGTTITKLKADGVSAPAIDQEVNLDGEVVTFLANEYMKYPIEAGVLTPSGPWKVYAVYKDSTPKELVGDVSNFNVLPRS